jgi:hypothetical protein
VVSYLVLALQWHFLLTILYREGNLFIKGSCPIHRSSQNLVWVPDCTLNLPLSNTNFFTSIKLDQKCESPFFFSTWEKVLFFKYFRLRICCHNPSSFNNLKIHLLSKHLFCISRSKMPNPPMLLGL